MRASKSSLTEKGDASNVSREDTVSLCHRCAHTAAVPAVAPRHLQQLPSCIACRLICEEAKRVLSKSPNLERVELSFGALKRAVAKYSVTVSHYGAVLAASRAAPLSAAAGFLFMHKAAVGLHCS